MFTRGFRVLAGAGAAILILSAAAAAQEAEVPESQPAPAVATVEASPPPDAEQSPREEEEEPLPSEVRTPAQVSAEDVLREFQRDRPKAQPLLPKAQEDETIGRRPVDRAGQRSTRLRMPDGYFLVDRTGRLTQVDTWWVFNFVGDNNPDESPDPPIRLLPNQMLERMIRESQGASRSVDFIISGEVTDFMGANYLLLRKLMRKRDQGNLSK